MAFLLDTNAWIVYLKSANSPIRARLETLSPADVLLCSVVKAELFHGAQKYGNRERRLRILAETFAPYNSLPFGDSALNATTLVHQLPCTRHRLIEGCSRRHRSDPTRVFSFSLKSLNKDPDLIAFPVFDRSFQRRVSDQFTKPKANSYARARL